MRSFIISSILVLSLLAFVLLYPGIKQGSSFFIKEVNNDKIILKNNGTNAVELRMLIIRCGGKVERIEELNLRLEQNKSLEISVNLSSIRGCELTFISRDGSWASCLISSGGWLLPIFIIYPEE